MLRATEGGMAERLAQQRKRDALRNFHRVRKASMPRFTHKFRG